MERRVKHLHEVVMVIREYETSIALLDGKKMTVRRDKASGDYIITVCGE